MDGENNPDMDSRENPYPADHGMEGVDPLQYQYVLDDEDNYSGGGAEGYVDMKDHKTSKTVCSVDSDRLVIDIEKGENRNLGKTSCVVENTSGNKNLGNTFHVVETPSLCGNEGSSVSQQLVKPAENESDGFNLRIENCYSMRQLTLRQMMDRFEKNHDQPSILRPGTKEYMREQVLYAAMRKHNVRGIHSGISADFYKTLVSPFISLKQASRLKKDIYTVLKGRSIMESQICKQNECSDYYRSVMSDIEYSKKRGDILPKRYRIHLKEDSVPQTCQTGKQNKDEVCKRLPKHQRDATPSKDQVGLDASTSQQSGQSRQTKESTTLSKCPFCGFHLVFISNMKFHLKTCKNFQQFSIEGSHGKNQSLTHHERRLPGRNWPVSGAPQPQARPIEASYSQCVEGEAKVHNEQESEAEMIRRAFTLRKETVGLNLEGNHSKHKLIPGSLGKNSSANSNEWDKSQKGNTPVRDISQDIPLTRNSRYEEMHMHPKVMENRPTDNMHLKIESDSEVSKSERVESTSEVHEISFNKECSIKVEIEADSSEYDPCSSAIDKTHKDVNVGVGINRQTKRNINAEEKNLMHDLRSKIMNSDQVVTIANEMQKQYLVKLCKINSEKEKIKRKTGKDIKFVECHICNEVLKGTHSLWVHIVSKHVDWKRVFELEMKSSGFGPYFCSHCLRDCYLKVGEVQKHERRVHLLSFPCYFCGLSVGTLAGNLEHVSQVHGLLYKCRHCKEEFYSHLEFKNHCKKRKHSMISIAEEPHGCPHFCPYCLIKNFDKEGLVSHLKFEHYYKRKIFPCEKQCYSCKGAFLDQQAVRFHQSPQADNLLYAQPVLLKQLETIPKDEQEIQKLKESHNYTKWVDIPNISSVKDSRGKEYKYSPATFAAFLDLGHVGTPHACFVIRLLLTKILEEYPQLVTEFSAIGDEVKKLLKVYSRSEMFSQCLRNAGLQSLPWSSHLGRLQNEFKKGWSLMSAQKKIVGDSLCGGIVSPRVPPTSTVSSAPTVDDSLFRRNVTAPILPTPTASSAATVDDSLFKRNVTAPILPTPTVFSAATISESLYRNVAPQVPLMTAVVSTATVPPGKQSPDKSYFSSGAVVQKNASDVQQVRLLFDLTSFSTQTTSCMKEDINIPSGKKQSEMKGENIQKRKDADVETSVSIKSDLQDETLEKPPSGLEQKHNVVRKQKLIQPLPPQQANQISGNIHGFGSVQQSPHTIIINNQQGGSNTIILGNSMNQSVPVNNSIHQPFQTGTSINQSFSAGNSINQSFPASFTPGTGQNMILGTPNNFSFFQQPYQNFVIANSGLAMNQGQLVLGPVINQSQMIHSGLASPFQFISANPMPGILQNINSSMSQPIGVNNQTKLEPILEQNQLPFTRASAKDARQMQSVASHVDMKGYRKIVSNGVDLKQNTDNSKQNWKVGKRLKTFGHCSTIYQRKQKILSSRKEYKKRTKPRLFLTNLTTCKNIAPKPERVFPVFGLFDKSSDEVSKSENETHVPPSSMASIDYSSEMVYCEKTGKMVRKSDRNTNLKCEKTASENVTGIEDGCYDKEDDNKVVPENRLENKKRNLRGNHVAKASKDGSILKGTTSSNKFTERSLRKRKGVTTYIDEYYDVESDTSNVSEVVLESLESDRDCNSPVTKKIKRKKSYYKDKEWKPSTNELVYNCCEIGEIEESNVVEKEDDDEGDSESEKRESEILNQIIELRRTRYVKKRLEHEQKIGEIIKIQDDETGYKRKSIAKKDKEKRITDCYVKLVRNSMAERLAESLKQSSNKGKLDEHVEDPSRSETVNVSENDTLLCDSTKKTVSKHHVTTNKIAPKQSIIQETRSKEHISPQTKSTIRKRGRPRKHLKTRDDTTSALFSGFNKNDKEKPKHKKQNERERESETSVKESSPLSQQASVEETNQHATPKILPTATIIHIDNVGNEIQHCSKEEKKSLFKVGKQKKDTRLKGSRSIRLRNREPLKQIVTRLASNSKEHYTDNGKEAEMATNVEKKECSDMSSSSLVDPPDEEIRKKGTEKAECSVTDNMLEEQPNVSCKRKLRERKKVTNYIFDDSDTESAESDFADSISDNKECFERKEEIEERNKSNSKQENEQKEKEKMLDKGCEKIECEIAKGPPVQSWNMAPTPTINSDSVAVSKMANSLVTSISSQRVESSSSQVPYQLTSQLPQQYGDNVQEKTLPSFVPSSVHMSYQLTQQYRNIVQNKTSPNFASQADYFASRKLQQMRDLIPKTVSQLTNISQPVQQDGLNDLNQKCEQSLQQTAEKSSNQPKVRRQKTRQENQLVSEIQSTKKDLRPSQHQVGRKENILADELIKTIKQEPEDMESALLKLAVSVQSNLQQQEKEAEDIKVRIPNVFVQQQPQQQQQKHLQSHFINQGSFSQQVVFPNPNSLQSVSASKTTSQQNSETMVLRYPIVYQQSAPNQAEPQTGHAVLIPNPQVIQQQQQIQYILQQGKLLPQSMVFIQPQSVMPPVSSNQQQNPQLVQPQPQMSFFSSPITKPLQQNQQSVQLQSPVSLSSQITEPLQQKQSQMLLSKAAAKKPLRQKLVKSSIILKQPQLSPSPGSAAVSQQHGMPLFLQQPSTVPQQQLAQAGIKQQQQLAPTGFTQQQPQMAMQAASTVLDKLKQHLHQPPAVLSSASALSPAVLSSASALSPAVLSSASKYSSVVLSTASVVSTVVSSSASTLSPAVLSSASTWNKIKEQIVPLNPLVMQQPQMMLSTASQMMLSTGSVASNPSTWNKIKEQIVPSNPLLMQQPQMMLSTGSQMMLSTGSVASNQSTHMMVQHPLCIMSPSYTHPLMFGSQSLGLQQIQQQQQFLIQQQQTLLSPGSHQQVFLLPGNPGQGPSGAASFFIGAPSGQPVTSSQTSK